MRTKIHVYDFIITKNARILHRHAFVDFRIETRARNHDDHKLSNSNSTTKCMHNMGMSRLLSRVYNVFLSGFTSDEMSWVRSVKRIRVYDGVYWMTTLHEFRIRMGTGAGNLSMSRGAALHFNLQNNLLVAINEILWRTILRFFFSLLWNVCCVKYRK
jgi:hypothetical protein